MTRNGYTFLTCLDLNNKCCAKDEAYAWDDNREVGGFIALLPNKEEGGAGVD